MSRRTSSNRPPRRREENLLHSRAVVPEPVKRKRIQKFVGNHDPAEAARVRFPRHRPSIGISRRALQASSSLPRPPRGWFRSSRSRFFGTYPDGPASGLRENPGRARLPRLRTPGFPAFPLPEVRGPRPRSGRGFPRKTDEPTERCKNLRFFRSRPFRRNNSRGADEKAKARRTSERRPDPRLLSPFSRCPKASAFFLREGGARRAIYTSFPRF